MKLAILLMLALCAQGALAQTLPAFPGAEGFGAVASGGRGGQVLYVTTLNPDPNGEMPGSLNWALRQPGARYVLFKVSGVIHAPATLRTANVTLAGQTSPGGITVRGLVCDGHYDRNDCSNVIVRHLRTRPAFHLPLPAGGERLDDALRLDGIRRFIFDHLSIANADDEAVQLSWASEGTIQWSALGETVGEHFDRGGMLINYSHPNFPQDQLSIHHNLWYRVGGRLPEITCESSNFPDLPGLVGSCQNTPLRIELANNLYHDVGFYIFYNKDVDQNAALGPYRMQMNLINNRFVVRPEFAFGMIASDFLTVPSNQLYWSGNGMSRYPSFSDYQLAYCCNDFPTAAPNMDFGVAQRLSVRHGFPAIGYTSTAQLPSVLLAQVGAFPRDPQLRRWLARVAAGSFDPTPLDQAGAKDAFALDFAPGAEPPAPADRDVDGMPDEFEVRHANLGMNPDIADPNGSQLSLPLTGQAGYSNLEVYLNLLADSLSGQGEMLFRSGFESL